MYQTIHLEIFFFGVYKNNVHSWTSYNVCNGNHNILLEYYKIYKIVHHNRRIYVEIFYTMVFVNKDTSMYCIYFYKYNPCILAMLFVSQKSLIDSKSVSMSFILQFEFTSLKVKIYGESSCNFSINISNRSISTELQHKKLNSNDESSLDVLM